MSCAQCVIKALSPVAILLSLLFYVTGANSEAVISEAVQACVVAPDAVLTNALRNRFAQCLGWQSDPNVPICKGTYQSIATNPLSDPDEVRIFADSVSFYQNKPSTLKGHVEIQQNLRIVNAQTAFVYRDAHTNKISQIELLGDVRYREPGKLMIARSAKINPQDKSGETKDVLYRFNTDRRSALLPAWGRASLIQRFANKDYTLHKATYTTCAPKDKAWDIQADTITLDDAKARGVARHALLRFGEWPIMYTPYLSFPTNKNRKSGFLQPILGYSNVGGFDFAMPYYWNMAPNYDLTLTPHVYSERGLMLGGEYRYVTSNSSGTITGDFLPNDRAFANFLSTNEVQFPSLADKSSNRWSMGLLDSTQITPNLFLNINVERVSDDYYLQDFSSNLALMTERQLLSQADLTYVTDNWTFRGLGQSYQTLHPVNEIPVANVYERLPQLMAHGFYSDLPFHANLSILGQYDQFNWPKERWENGEWYPPQGPRFHANPVLSLPQVKPWGYITPSIQIVENYYEVDYNRSIPSADYNLTLPRYSIDGGLYFERSSKILGSSFTQTLEPRLFYLNVPYQNQTAIPVYDSGYMIFNMDQLFRTNRFSGYDRIGDANQLAYALTSRWLSEATGRQRASLSIGQIAYFSNRQVQLCQNLSGSCVENPSSFGYLSPTSETSPIASRAVYNFNPFWGITGDYIWSTSTKATNNADLNVHYQPKPNTILNFGYSYLVNGDVTRIRDDGTENNALHQAIIAFAWPLTEKWSTVGAYSQNISKNYSMMSLVGLQYDSCCWAVRLLG
ncbi:MAG: LPS-assembly protein LptD, partial [Legionellales bacterium]